MSGPAGETLWAGVSRATACLQTVGRGTAEKKTAPNDRGRNTCGTHAAGCLLREEKQGGNS